MFTDKEQKLLTSVVQVGEAIKRLNNEERTRVLTASIHLMCDRRSAASVLVFHREPEGTQLNKPLSP